MNMNMETHTLMVTNIHIKMKMDIVKDILILRVKIRIKTKIAFKT